MSARHVLTDKQIEKAKPAPSRGRYMLPAIAWTPISRCVLVSLLLIASPASAHSPPASPTQAPSTAMPSKPGQNPPLPRIMPQSVPAIARTNCDAFLPPGAMHSLAKTATLVSVRITADGEMSDPTLFRPSGDPDFDKAVLACADGFHFGGVLVAGKPTEVSWVVAHLATGFGPANALIANHPCKSSHTGVYPARIPAEATTTLSYRIGANGTVKDVAVTRSSGVDVLDKAAAECAATWRFYPATQNGTPVEVDKVLDVHWGRR